MVQICTIQKLTQYLKHNLKDSKTMASLNSKTPAFPCVESYVETKQGSSFEMVKTINHTGLTKREFMAARLAPALIKPVRTPKTFIDFLKIKMNEIGFNFRGIRYKYNQSPVQDAQLVAIYADAMLNQLEGKHVG